MTAPRGVVKTSLGVERAHVGSAIELRYRRPIATAFFATQERFTFYHGSCVGTTDWRAVCGRTARTVRRAGTAKAVPDPYRALMWRLHWALGSDHCRGANCTSGSIGCNQACRLLQRLASTVGGPAAAPPPGECRRAFRNS